MEILLHASRLAFARTSDGEKCRLVEKEWPDFMSKLKSKTVIFAHNILSMYYLQHILKRSTGH